MGTRRGWRHNILINSKISMDEGAEHGTSRFYRLRHLQKECARFQKETAIQSEDGRITFGELYERVNAVAGRLVSEGIRPGDRIAVLTKNRPEFFILAGAIAAAGAIMVPINFRLSAEEVGYNLTIRNRLLIVVDPDYEKTVSALCPACSVAEETDHLRPRREFEPFDSLSAAGR